MAMRGAIFILIGLLYSTTCAQPSFLALSSVSALGANVICNKIPGLTPKQRSLCHTRPDAVVAIGEGSKVSTQECQWQFRHMRWNCSQMSDGAPFGHDLPIASKEAGYAHAISSAGVAYAITQACSSGGLKGCGCDAAKADGRWSPGGWRWGGCSADVDYGVEFARIFVDARETEVDARALANLHNNRVGRKILAESVEVECKCHGPSGSCTMKTCWTTLPSFRKIGDSLMDKFSKAKRVVAPPAHRRSPKQRSSSPLPPTVVPPLASAHRLELRRSRRENSGRPRTGDLVFLDDSPTYCEPDRRSGHPGTRGRQCNRTSDSTEGCHLMCCGRGYNTHEVSRAWQCDCKFHWCCHVTCRTCAERREVYTCK